MFCAACAEETASEPCSHCGADPLLDGRYRLEHALGRGATDITWAATRLDDGSLVAIKAVPLPPGLAAKDRELVAREVEVLRQIRHPAIPELFDAFQVRGGAGVRMQYMVQEFVPGRTLAEELPEHRFDEGEVLAVLEQVLPVLVYLHGLSPPVVHRDLKPRNLMRRPDGSLVLIDFGAVKAALSDPHLGGSTVAGTFGYMAPEQFRGDAEARSDLYALGATAVALLSRAEPRTLLDHGGQLQWQDQMRVSHGMAALLEALLARDPARRPSAREALERVARLHEAPPAPPPAPVRRPPETPGNSNALGTALGVSVGLVAIGAVLFSSIQEKEAAQAPIPIAPVAEPCGGAPCVPVAEFALRGLSLGQTVDEARAAFPELADAERADPELRFSHQSPMSGISFGSSASVPVPGEAWTVRTLVADTASSCDLYFAAPGDRLSRVMCRMDSPPSEADLEAAAGRVAEGLAERHGRGTTGNQRELGWRTNWEWSDQTGSILLIAEHQDFGMGRGVLAKKESLSLEVTARTHEQARQEADARATEQARAQQARREAETEADRQRELEELRSKAGEPSGGL